MVGEQSAINSFENQEGVEIALRLDQEQDPKQSGRLALANMFVSLQHVSKHFPSTV